MKCIRCGSQDTVWSSDFEKKIADIECLSCGNSWQENYTPDFKTEGEEQEGVKHGNT